MLARNQIGMLALPAEARLGRKRFFHQRRGIDEDFHVSAALLNEGARELFQAFFQDVVIVLTARIDRDIAL